MTDTLKPTQADVNAAADWYNVEGRRGCGTLAEAFARHRLSSDGEREALIERAAKCAEACDLYDGDHLLNSDPRITVAAAIRSALSRNNGNG